MGNKWTSLNEARIKPDSLGRSQKAKVIHIQWNRSTRNAIAKKKKKRGRDPKI